MNTFPIFILLGLFLSTFGRNWQEFDLRNNEYVVEKKGEEADLYEREWEVEDDEEELFQRVARATDYSSADKNAMVDKHNKLRKKVSPGASDMQMMEWDDTIASYAQEWANGCRFQHRDNLKTLGYGENLFLGSAKPTPDAVVQAWYDEVSDFSYRSNDCQPGKMCGHYTQVVWAKSNKVGCGIKNCPIGWLVVCDYSPAGNWAEKLPYQTGGTCSLCPNEASACKKGLCSDCKPGKGSCECNRKCKNCGELTKKCTCNCADGFFGPNCETKCADLEADCDPSPGQLGWPPQWCDVYDFVREGCPLMCGACNPPSKNFACKG